MNESDRPAGPSELPEPPTAPRTGRPEEEGAAPEPAGGPPPAAPPGSAKDVGEARERERDADARPPSEAAIEEPPPASGTAEVEGTLGELPALTPPEGEAPEIPDRLSRLRQRVRPLVAELEARRASLERARADHEQSEKAVESARASLSEAEQVHAQALARSYREEGAESTSSLDSAARALDEARGRLRTAEADRGQAARAVELLRSDVGQARAALHRGATEAKREAAEAVLGELRLRWSGVRALVEELKAIPSVPHGDDPPVVAAAQEAAGSFERRVLERRAEGTPVARRARGIAGIAARFVLTLVGAGGLVFGSFAPWFRDAGGFDLDYRVYLDPAALESLAPRTLLAGAITLVLGILAVVGLAFRTGWVTRVAGALGLAAALLVVATLFRSPSADLPGDAGVGLWLTGVGSAIVLGAGLVGTRPRRR